MKFNDLLQRVRAHPALPAYVTGLGDDDFAYAVGQLTFSVLQDLGEVVGRSFGAKRNYTFSDPANTTVTLGGDGSADLTTLIAEKGLLLENLQYGEILHPDSPWPMLLCNSSGEGGLPGNHDSIFLHYWLVGVRIKTRSGDGNQTPLAGDLSFACPRVNGLDTLSPQLADDLVEAVVMRLKGGLQPMAPKTPPAGSPE